MPLYRHATNLELPLSITDMSLLRDLPEYRFGIPLKPQVPRDTDNFPPEEADLLLHGYVGLYTTRRALKIPEIQARTGWHHPDRVLGAIWRPLGGGPSPEMTEEP